MPDTTFEVLDDVNGQPLAADAGAAASPPPAPEETADGETTAAAPASTTMTQEEWDQLNQELTAARASAEEERAQRLKHEGALTHLQTMFEQSQRAPQTRAEAAPEVSPEEAQKRAVEYEQYVNGWSQNATKWFLEKLTPEQRTALDERLLSDPVSTVVELSLQLTRRSLDAELKRYSQYVDKRIGDAYSYLTEQQRTDEWHNTISGDACCQLGELFPALAAFHRSIPNQELRTEFFNRTVWATMDEIAAQMKNPQNGQPMNAQELLAHLYRTGDQQSVTGFLNAVGETIQQRNGNLLSPFTPAPAAAPAVEAEPEPPPKPRATGTKPSSRAPVETKKKSATEAMMDAMSV